MKDQADYYRLARNQHLMSRLPLKERISQQQLEHLLRTEFRNNNIDLDFKYAVKSYPQGKEQLVFGSKNYSPDSRKEYHDLLFPRDLEPKGDYLRVYFPRSDTYLLKETGIMVIPTDTSHRRSSPFFTIRS
jgi:two-component system phosphate regulon sensor histidine kinase PhoR